MIESFLSAFGGILFLMAFALLIALAMNPDVLHGKRLNEYHINCCFITDNEKYLGIYKSPKDGKPLEPKEVIIDCVSDPDDFDVVEKFIFPKSFLTEHTQKVHDYFLAKALKNNNKEVHLDTREDIFIDTSHLIEMANITFILSYTEIKFGIVKRFEYSPSPPIRTVMGLTHIAGKHDKIIVEFDERYFKSRKDEI